MEDIKERFTELIEEGLKVIPKSFHQKWQEYIYQFQKMDSNDIIEFLDECTVITSYLLKFKDSSGASIAHEFYNQFNYKNNYSKRLASKITRFAPYPKNIEFIQRYYECFIDITRQEESNLTEEITQIKRLNSLIAKGLTNEEAESLSIAKTINLEINGQIIPVIEETNNLYYGISEDNKLIIYKSIDDIYDVLYFLNVDGTYNRLISRHQKWTPDGIIPLKSILTDQENKIISIDNYDILINANFMDLDTFVNYYRKIKDLEESTTNTSIIEECSHLSEPLTDKNHNLCSFIFSNLLNDNAKIEKQNSL